MSWSPPSRELLDVPAGGLETQPGLSAAAARAEPLARAARFLAIWLLQMPRAARRALDAAIRRLDDVPAADLPPCSQCAHLVGALGRDPGTSQAAAAGADLPLDDADLLPAPWDALPLPVQDALLTLLARLLWAYPVPTEHADHLPTAAYVWARGERDAAKNAPLMTLAQVAELPPAAGDGSLPGDGRLVAELARLAPDAMAAIVGPALRAWAHTVTELPAELEVLALFQGHLGNGSYPCLTHLTVPLLVGAPAAPQLAAMAARATLTHLRLADATLDAASLAADLAAVPPHVRFLVVDGVETGCTALAFLAARPLPPSLRRLGINLVPFSPLPDGTRAAALRALYEAARVVLAAHPALEALVVAAPPHLQLSDAELAAAAADPRLIQIRCDDDAGLPPPDDPRMATPWQTWDTMVDTRALF